MSTPEELMNVKLPYIKRRSKIPYFTKIISIRLSPEMYEKMKQFVKKYEFTDVSDFIRRAISWYLKQFCY